MLDSEYARRAVGEVSVPFGICREPSNVAAAGRACPFRFRCIGCDHFRADASSLPELTAYLDDLLRTRERLTAALAASEAGDADEVQVQNPAELGEVELLGGLVVKAYAGVVDQPVDAPVTAERRRHPGHGR